MKRIDREQFMKDNFVICDCGYPNNKRAVDFYGNCVCCKRVLNPQAYFKYNLRKATNQWRFRGCVR